MTSIMPFPGAIVRALVIEQLNSDQWHTVLRGADAADDSLEAHPGGVGSYASAVVDAVEVADLTGLPVFVEPYQQDATPLISPPTSRAFWHHRFRRGSALDHLMYGPAGRSGAA